METCLSWTLGHLPVDGDCGEAKGDEAAPETKVAAATGGGSKLTPVSIETDRDAYVCRAITQALEILNTEWDAKHVNGSRCGVLMSLFFDDKMYVVSTGQSRAVLVDPSLLTQKELEDKHVNAQKEVERANKYLESQENIVRLAGGVDQHGFLGKNKDRLAAAIVNLKGADSMLNTVPQSRLLNLENEKGDGAVSSVTVFSKAECDGKLLVMASPSFTSVYASSDFHGVIRAITAKSFTNPSNSDIAGRILDKAMERDAFTDATVLVDSMEWPSLETKPTSEELSLEEIQKMRGMSTREFRSLLDDDDYRNFPQVKAVSEKLALLDQLLLTPRLSYYNFHGIDDFESKLEERTQALNKACSATYALEIGKFTRWAIGDARRRAQFIFQAYHASP